MIHTHPIFPLDTSWLENHSPNYLPLTTLTSKWVDCPGGRRFNNNSRTTGKGGLPTTLRLQHHQRWHRSSPTYNLEILCSWGRTTRLHFTGLQRSSLMSTQAQTARYEWSQSRPPKGHSNALLQKFTPFRMLKMSYSSITIWGVPVCSCRGQIYWILPFGELIFTLISFDYLLCWVLFVLVNVNLPINVYLYLNLVFRALLGGGFPWLVCICIFLF